MNAAARFWLVQVMHACHGGSDCIWELAHWASGLPMIASGSDRSVGQYWVIKHLPLLQYFAHCAGYKHSCVGLQTTFQSFAHATMQLLSVESEVGNFTNQIVHTASQQQQCPWDQGHIILLCPTGASCSKLCCSCSLCESKRHDSPVRST